MKRGRRWAARWLLLLFLAPSRTEAAALAVAPLRIDLGPGQRIATLTVTNEDAGPVMIQTRTYAWPRTAATEDLEPTQDLLAVPAIVTVPAGGQQVIRVALRGRAAPGREATYRVVIAEVPQAEAEDRTGVRFALAFSLPVFVPGQGAAPDPRWSIVGGATSPVLRLTNAGTAHIQVRGIRLGDPAGREIRIEEPAYVLAGQVHDWAIGPGVRPSGEITLRADTDRGEIKTRVAGVAR